VSAAFPLLALPSFAFIEEHHWGRKTVEGAGEGEGKIVENAEKIERKG
jgi:hypothetical protein